MDNDEVLTKEDEEFLDSLFKASRYVCANCLSTTEVDDDQSYTYCEFCEAFTEVKEES